MFDPPMCQSAFKICVPIDTTPNTRNSPLWMEGTPHKQIAIRERGQVNADHRCSRASGVTSILSRPRIALIHSTTQAPSDESACNTDFRGKS
jgi:hypothetical protein